MTNNRLLSSRGSKLTQSLAIYAWLTVLTGTDSYYSVYLLCGSFGMICLWNHRPGRVGSAQWLGGALFSLAVAAANYPLYTPLSVLQNLFNIALLLAGGFVVGIQVLTWMADRLPLDSAPGVRRRPGRVFALCFTVVAVIDLGYLFFCRYPGIMTTDSFATMEQLLGLRGYDNVMPFWHTVTVKLFVDLGLRLFGDLHPAIALYHGVQALFMAACVAYVMVTLYQMRVPLPWLAGVFAVYALAPHNIVYSVTLWKDIPFAGATVLLVTALYRMLQDIGRHPWQDKVIFTLGAFGFCLWRSNGWYAFVVTTVVMAVFLYREHRGLLAAMAAISLLSWLLIGPVLKMWGVGETNFTEAFAIPMQQIARVIWQQRPLSQQDTELLSQVFYLDRVRELYDAHNVDAVKYFTFRAENLPYLLENKLAYGKLYLRLALQYPADFFQAWVEQTKGYWNGGYCYYTYTQVLGENTLGLVQQPGQGLVSRLYAALFRYLEKPDILQWMTSIGLHTWALAASAVTMAAQRRKEFVLTLPVLVLIVGLWLGTPVYAEFRYAYPMMLTMPMILTVTLYGQKERTRL